MIDAHYYHYVSNQQVIIILDLPKTIFPHPALTADAKQMIFTRSVHRSTRYVRARYTDAQLNLEYQPECDSDHVTSVTHEYFTMTMLSEALLLHGNNNYYVG